MNDDWVEIKESRAEGYQPLVDFGTWRVAILHWDETSTPEKIAYLERHTETDEVFVLLRGRAKLILGGNALGVDRLVTQLLAGGRLYNVRQNVWHTVLLSRDATILIVENQDTGEGNTEYIPLTPGQRQQLAEWGEGW